MEIQPKIKPRIKIIIKPKIKHFENIHLDLLYDILSKLYLNDLGNISCINKFFIEKILNNQEFWRRNYLNSGRKIT